MERMLDGIFVPMIPRGCLSWNAGLKDIKFRLIWKVILCMGFGFMSLAIQPIKIFKFAQVTNGLLLPIIAISLLWAVNKSSVWENLKTNRFEIVLV